MEKAGEGRRWVVGTPAWVSLGEAGEGGAQLWEDESSESFFSFSIQRRLHIKKQWDGPLERERCPSRERVTGSGSLREWWARR